MNYISKSRKPNFIRAFSIIEKSSKCGIYINNLILSNLINSLKIQQDKIYADIIEETYEGFNPNSSREVASVLSTKCDLNNYVEKTKKGNLSIKSTILQKIYDNEGIELAKLIIDYRSLNMKLAKLLEICEKMEVVYGKSGDQLYFVYPFPKMALTNRIYYYDPSISNLSEEAKTILTGYENYSLVKFDYKQQEAFIMVNWFDIKEIKDKLNSGEFDIYKSIARYLFEIEEVDEELRSKVKTAWLATAYGASKSTIAEQLNNDKSAIQLYEMINNIPEIKEVKRRIDKEIEQGDYYVRSYFGTLRDLTDSGDVGHIKRAKFNNMIQMTASDILAFAIEDIQDYIERNSLQNEVRLAYTLHDEIAVYIDNSNKELFDKVISDIKEILRYKVDDWLPFEVDIEIL